MELAALEEKRKKEADKEAARLLEDKDKAPPGRPDSALPGQATPQIVSQMRRALDLEQSSI